jgi:hypothetical protein
MSETQEEMTAYSEAAPGDGAVDVARGTTGRSN